MKRSIFQIFLGVPTLNVLIFSSLIFLSGCAGAGLVLAESELLLIRSAGVVYRASAYAVESEVALSARFASVRLAKVGSRRILRARMADGTIEDFAEVISKRQFRTLKSGQIIHLEGDLFTVSSKVKVNLRSGPSKDYASKAVLNEGRPVAVMETSNGWSRVKVSDELEGWIKRTLIDEVKDYVKDEITQEIENQIFNSTSSNNSSENSDNVQKPNLTNVPKKPKKFYSKSEIESNIVGKWKVTMPGKGYSPWIEEYTEEGVIKVNTFGISVNAWQAKDKILFKNVGTSWIGENLVLDMTSSFIIVRDLSFNNLYFFERL